MIFFFCSNDEENIRRGKEEAEEPEFQNSFGIRNSSVCACVCFCIFGNTSTLPFSLLLLLLLFHLGKVKIYAAPRSKKINEKSWSPWFHTTDQNSNPFQSRQQINKSQYVIEFFPPFLLLNNFRRTHFCGFSFHILRLPVYVCVCVCVRVWLLFLISIMISRRSFHSSQFQFPIPIPNPIRVFELRFVFISNSNRN